MEHFYRIKIYIIKVLRNKNCPVLEIVIIFQEVCQELDKRKRHRLIGIRA
jgi:hypothetical protein